MSNFFLLLVLLTDVCRSVEGLIKSRSRQEPGTLGLQCHWRETLETGNPGHQMCPGYGITQAHEDAGETARIALVIRGESFRSGAGEFDRQDCVTAESFASQAEASLSHLHYVVEPLEACGVGVDVFLGTYFPKGSALTVNSTEALIALYSNKRVVRTLFVANEEKGNWDQRRMFDESLSMVVEQAHDRRVNYPNYTAILVLRHDLVLKQELVNFHEAAWHKVLFAFEQPHDSCAYQAFFNYTPTSDLCVSDVLQWIPWPYVGCAIGVGFGGHKYGAALRDVAGEDSVNFVSPGVHRSNTAKESNDLYRLVRAEGASPIQETSESVLTALS